MNSDLLQVPLNYRSTVRRSRHHGGLRRTNIRVDDLDDETYYTLSSDDEEKGTVQESDEEVKTTLDVRHSEVKKRDNLEER